MFSTAPNAHSLFRRLPTRGLPCSGQPLIHRFVLQAVIISYEGSPGQERSTPGIRTDHDPRSTPVVSTPTLEGQAPFRTGHRLCPRR